MVYKTFCLVGLYLIHYSRGWSIVKSQPIDELERIMSIAEVYSSQDSFRLNDKKRGLTAVKDRQLRSCFVNDYDPYWLPAPGDKNYIIRSQPCEKVDMNTNIYKLKKKAGPLIADMCKELYVFWMATHNMAPPPLLQDAQPQQQEPEHCQYVNSVHEPRGIDEHVGGIKQKLDPAVESQNGNIASPMVQGGGMPFMPPPVVHGGDMPPPFVSEGILPTGGQISPSENVNGAPPMLHNGRPPMSHEQSSLIPRDQSPPTIHEAPQMLRNGEQPMLHDKARPKVDEGVPPMFHEGAPPMVYDGAQPMSLNGQPPILHGEATPMLHEGAPPMLIDGAPPMLHEGAPPMLIDGAPPMLHDGAPPMVDKGTPPLLHDGASLMPGDGPPPMLEKDAPPMVEKDAPPMLEKNAPPMLEKDAPPMLEKGIPPMLEKDAPPMLEKDAPPMLEKGAPPMLEKDAPPMLEKGAPRIFQEGASVILKDAEYAPRQSQNPNLSDKEVREPQMIKTQPPLNILSAIAKRLPSDLLDERVPPRMKILRRMMGQTKHTLAPPTPDMKTPEPPPLLRRM